MVFKWVMSVKSRDRQLSFLIGLAKVDRCDLAPRSTDGNFDTLPVKETLGYRKRKQRESYVRVLGVGMQMRWLSLVDGGNLLGVHSGTLSGGVGGGR